MRSLAGCIAISICLGLILCGMPPGAHASTEDAVKRVQPATVIIHVYDKAGRSIGQGSGFLYRSPGRLITNFHVLGNAEMAMVRAHDGRELAVKCIVAENKADDLIEALVEIPSGTLPYLYPAGSTPKPGDSVMVIGSPMGVNKVVTQGSVLAIQEVPKYGKCIVHSAHSFPGSSGSPLVNDQGQVIGIATAASPGNPDINVAVPLERFSGLSPVYRPLQPRSTRATSVPQGNSKTEPVQKETRMAEPADPAGQVKLAMMYEQGQGTTQNCFEALSLYQKAANQGYMQAEYHLGRMYYEGSCMGKNANFAANWLKKAAERGFPAAQRLLGKLYFNGEGVARDRVAACMWVILANNRGDQEAMKVLRYMSAELSQTEVKIAAEKARNWKSVN